MNSKEIRGFLEERTEEIYKNPDSLLMSYEQFLLENGLYLSNDPMTFHKKIKGRMDLCEKILRFYYEARLENEKISFLEDLYAIGYDKNKLAEIILEVFFSDKCSSYLWEYGDLLYNLKRYKYLPQYIRIIEDKSYGSDRQMLVLLVGKSKKESVIPVLKRLLNDEDVYGHALDALCNFKGSEIEEIMKRYVDCKETWVRNTAKKYLKQVGVEF